ncbi:hypothetical protein ACQ33O_03295 [Ferruginibacter sp. SUN002]|uniref:hypothetical protein n=1 Tax=Ferruginibacter sp. SUN002 TaxID=2937789 RepID=UPI003D35A9F0
MKSILLSSLLLLSLGFLLTACPVATKFPLTEKEDLSTFDKRLIGEWVNSDSAAEAKKIRITKGETKKTYHIEVLEKGSMFMAESETFEAWITDLDDKKFIVLQEIKDGETDKSYYVYHLEITDDYLITHDVSLKVKGIDGIKSVSTYREEVSASMTFKDFLSEERKWTKE